MRHMKGNNGTKCRGGNCEKGISSTKNVEVETAENGNNGTMLQGVKDARHENTAKAEYGKPLINTGISRLTSHR